MTKMRVEYKGHLRAVATHLDSGATLITDAPKDNQGEGASFSPTDLMCTSLATCMLSIMGIKARSMDLDMTSVSVDVEKIMQASPRKVAEIKLHFHWGSVPEEHREILRKVALTCPVSLSLDSSVKQTHVW